jgi:hypothetical protein
MSLLIREFADLRDKKEEWRQHIARPINGTRGPFPFGGAAAITA